MVKEVIIQHEHVNRMPYTRHVAELARSQGFVSLPGVEDRQGSLQAYINHGRWVVNCPSSGCGGAVVASMQHPYFICPYCANDDNEHKWFNVEFPENYQEIEEVLLHRPSRSPSRAFNRNWEPGESLDQLKEENREHGILDD